MDEYLHVSIENMHAGNTGNPDRREKERRQQHYSDQARIAELEKELRETLSDLNAWDGSDEAMRIVKENIGATLAKG